MTLVHIVVGAARRANTVWSVVGTDVTMMSLTVSQPVVNKAEG